MKQRLSVFGLTGLFWLFFFETARVLFLVYHPGHTATLSVKDVLTTMILGLRMDAAMAAYWIVLTGFLLAWPSIAPHRWLGLTHHAIVFTLLFISCLIVVGDVELYRHWGFRMDATPLIYAGSEGLASAAPGTLVILATLFLFLVATFFWIYLRMISGRFSMLPNIKPAWSLAMVGVTALLFIPIRSSFTVSPLNTGVVYFHKSNAFANHAGINPVWHFFQALVNDRKVRYPENIFGKDQARRMLDAAIAPAGNSPAMLTSEKPNILVILLESFTAKIVEPLGGKAGITPELTKLAREGLLFDQFYANGDRTDKGVVAVLSGYPAQPLTSIMVYPNKTQSLPFLSRSLQAMGYHTSFVYGGDIGFANMESYMTTAGFDHVTSDDDFDSELAHSKWGVHDHLVFDQVMTECDTASTPFFKVMLSLSSHEPFDVPLDPPFLGGRDEASMFLNACYYTDKSLGEFIAKARSRSWWSNTWVVITADHGHRFPDPTELNVKERFHIPMLWLGGTLSKRDSVVHTFGSQTDIANTILGQLAHHERSFRFSKDILNRSTPSFAIYVFHNGYGFVDATGEYAFDFDAMDYLRANAAGERMELGKAYMQVLFEDYNSR